MSFRPFPIMTACVVPALAVLVMLGLWQWQRYNEKLSFADVEISWISFEGARHGPAFLVYTLLDGRPAWREVYLIDNGQDAVFASDTIYIGVDAPEIEDASDQRARFDQSVLVKPAGANAFTPDPSGNQLFAYDVSALWQLASYGGPAQLRAEVLEPRLLTVVDLERGERIETVENPWANPALADPLPPSRHLGYALTWWGIGIGLVIIYFVFHLQSGRLTFRQTI